MNIKIYPSEILSFCVGPPSYDTTLKSIIISALCKSVSKTECPDLSDDVLTTLAAVRAIGAGVMHVEGGFLISGIDINRPVREEHIHINTGQSIPTLCLMLPVATYLYRTVTFEFDCAAVPLLKAYEDIYRQRGLYFEYSDNSVTVSGRLEGGVFESRYPISFPFFDGLLILAVCFEKDSRIYFCEEDVFFSYLEHTVSLMKHFGANAVISRESIHIPGRQRYYGRNINAGKDHLKASQMMFLGSIRGGMEIYGFGDDIFPDPAGIVTAVMKRCDIPVYEDGNGYRVFHADMPSVTADLGKVPMLIPIMMVRCAFGTGYSVIKGADKVMYNEYSRITDMIYELRKADVDIGIKDGEIVIKGRRFYFGCEFSAHSDPVIAAALGVFCACCATPGTINGADAVNSWYPEIWEDMRSVGITVEEL